MTNYKETVQDSKSEAWHDEEIHGGDGFAMILQEDSPALGWFRILRCTSHPTRNGSLRNIEPQLQKFTMNARSTPGGVLSNHLENRFSQLPADSLPAKRFSMARDPIPLEGEIRSMPAHNSLGSSDNKSLLPFRPQPSDENPKEAVESNEFGLRFASLHGQKLLVKSQILQ
jgi:hypothetical protein